jgi:hypothetical protein
LLAPTKNSWAPSGGQESSVRFRTVQANSIASQFSRAFYHASLVRLRYPPALLSASAEEISLVSFGWSCFISNRFRLWFKTFRATTLDRSPHRSLYNLYGSFLSDFRFWHG